MAATKALWNNHGMGTKLFSWPWLLDKSGGAVVGAVVSFMAQYLYAAFTGNPDVAAVIVGAGVAGVFVITMLFIAHRVSAHPSQEGLKKSGDSPKEVGLLGGDAQIALLAQQVDELKAEKLALTNKQDELNLEVARLNEHRVGLLGSSAQTTSGLPVATPTLEITSVWDGVHVAAGQVIYGTVAPDILAHTVELRVFAGGRWHKQGKAAQFGNGWERMCWFGASDSPAESEYRIVAIVPKSPLPPKIAELPTDVLKSPIVTVRRWTPPIYKPSIKLVSGSPQGGQILQLGQFTADRWNCFVLLLQNTGDHWSACDLTVRLEFSRSTPDIKRVIELALFVDMGFNPDDKVAAFLSEINCLKVTQTATILLATWQNNGPVQTVSRWPLESESGGLSPRGFQHPLGEELYAGQWNCVATLTGQNLNVSESFTFLVKANSMSVLMPPPGGPY